jgi:hypothetical protein
MHEMPSDKNRLFYLENLDNEIYKMVCFELKKSAYKYALLYALMIDLFF